MHRRKPLAALGFVIVLPIVTQRDIALSIVLNALVTEFVPWVIWEEIEPAAGARAHEVAPAAAPRSAGLAPEALELAHFPPPLN